MSEQQEFVEANIIQQDTHSQQEQPAANAQDNATANESTEAAQSEDINAKLEAMRQEYESRIQALDNKNKEILAERKRDQEAKREAEEAARLAAESKADEKQLREMLESSRAETQKYIDELKARDQLIEDGVRKNAAMEVANKIASNPYNAELLAERIERQVAVIEGKPVVTDAEGRATVSSLDALASQVASDPRYASLVKGNQASGGGATGSGGRAPATKSTLTGEELESMSMVERERFYANQRN